MAKFVYFSIIWNSNFFTHVTNHGCEFFLPAESEQSTDAQRQSDAQARTEAAVKIQAAFRGHKVRMNLQKDDSSTCILPETEAEIEGTIYSFLSFPPFFPTHCRTYSKKKRFACQKGKAARIMFDQCCSWKPEYKINIAAWKCNRRVEHTTYISLNLKLFTILTKVLFGFLFAFE